MTHTFVATETTYWVAHGPALHFGVVQAGETISSGQEFFEHFDRLLPWRTRVIELGGNTEDMLLSEAEE